MYEQFAALRQFQPVCEDGEGVVGAPADNTPRKRKEGHSCLLKAPPISWGPYEILIWLTSPASRDRRPAANSLCDLVQVAPLLCASLSLSGLDHVELGNPAKYGTR